MFYLYLGNRNIDNVSRVNWNIAGMTVHAILWQEAYLIRSVVIVKDSVEFFNKLSSTQCKYSSFYDLKMWLDLTCDNIIVCNKDDS